jgi:hypothetical protein
MKKQEKSHPMLHGHHSFTHAEEVKGGKDSHHPDHHHKMAKHHHKEMHKHMHALHKMAKKAHSKRGK